MRSAWLAIEIALPPRAADAASARGVFSDGFIRCDPFHAGVADNRVSAMQFLSVAFQVEINQTSIGITMYQ